MTTRQVDTPDRASSGFGYQVVPPVTQRRRPTTPFVVLALGLVASAAVTYTVERATTERDRTRFDNVGRSVHDRIELRLSSYEAVLRSTAAIFAIHDAAVSRTQFARYVERADVQRVYPGIQGIGFVRRLSPAEVPALVAEMKAGGLPDFKIWPEGERDEYSAITSLEPHDRRPAQRLATT